MATLNKTLASQAHRLGICNEWHEELLTTDDRHALCDMYLRGIDFCLANNYPSNDFIKKNFGDIATLHGIFVDKGIDIRNRQKCVCLGTTHGKISLDSYAICELFAKNKSNVELHATDNSFAMCDIFDSAKIDVFASGKAKICINHYGGLINVVVKDDDAVVKIIEKNKETY